MVNPKPAPPTPRLHGKRRQKEDDYNYNLLAIHEKKKQKLEDNQEAINKQEVEMLLSTPVIERRRPLRADEFGGTPISVNSPHSILKVTYSSY